VGSEKPIKIGGKEGMKHLRSIVFVVIVAILFVALRYIATAEQAKQTTTTETQSSETVDGTDASNAETEIYYTYKSEEALKEDYKVNHLPFGNINKANFIASANNIIHNYNGKVLTKTAEESGDTVYYDPESNSIVFVTQDGYIRTCFKPDGRQAYFQAQ